MLNSYHGLGYDNNHNTFNNGWVMLPIGMVFGAILMALICCVVAIIGVVFGAIMHKWYRDGVTSREQKGERYRVDARDVDNV